MTTRLYYDDPYLLSFSALVKDVHETPDGRCEVRLDQSAFYPTSGGQPFDTGTINSLKVTDVFTDAQGDVIHVVEGHLEPGETVDCRIDRQRRIDHMQQHAGEHMLAGCVHRQLNGYTIGLHLGHADSSIDVELPGGRMRISDSEIFRLEDEVNAHIQADEPIRYWFPDAEELSRLPLRKAPAVSEHVRVVQIGNWEYCACGGTHPSSTGQIALLKIIDARPSKGKIRLTFLCGGRAFNDYRQNAQTVRQLSSILSAGADKLGEAAADTVKKLKDLRHELNVEKTERALDYLNSVEAISAMDDHSKSFFIIKHVFDDLHPDGLKLAAERVISKSAFVALLGSRGSDGISLLFAKSADVPGDMGKLLSDCAKLYGGKGGGKGDFARGQVPDARALDAALAILTDTTPNGGSK